MVSQLFRCHFSVSLPFVFHSLFSPSGLCDSTKSPEWSPQKCHVALSLCQRQTRKACHPDPTEDLCHLVEEGQVSQGWRGHHSSERHQGTMASQFWQESGPGTQCLPSEGNLTGECALYPERRNTATLVFLKTHTLIHTLHIPPQIPPPHIHTHHTHQTHRLP